MRSHWEQPSDEQGEVFVSARWSEQTAQTERTIILKNHRAWVGFLAVQLNHKTNDLVKA